MAVQQRRNSTTRTKKRRTHYKLSAPAIQKCPVCGEYKRSHHMCECGSTRAPETKEA
ncbi:MAG: 50S ribosomal protein L32 [Erysipelotrichaceae bacterium]